MERCLWIGAWDGTPESDWGYAMSYFSLSAHGETCLSWPCLSPPYLHYYWWRPLPVSALPRRCSHTRSTVPPSYSSPIKIIAPCHVGYGNWLLSLPCFYPTKSHLFSDFHFKGRTGCFVRRALISWDTLWACHALFIWFARYRIVGEMRSESLTGNKRDRGDRPVNSFFSRGPRPRKHCVTPSRRDPAR